MYSLSIAHMLVARDTNSLGTKNIIRDTTKMIENAKVNSHCSRETNQNTDFLAKLTSSSENNTLYHSFQHLLKEEKYCLNLI